MPQYIWLIAALVVALSAGCASRAPIALAPDAAAKLSGRSVVGVYGSPPSFIAYTPGRASIPFVGIAAIISEGNQLVTENAIADPAIRVSQLLAAALARQLNGQATKVADHLAPGEAVTTLRTQFPSADLLIDVRTEGWGYINYASNFAKYQSSFGAMVRLIDMKSGAVLAEGPCSGAAGNVDTAATYDELLANGSAKLKAELEQKGDECIEGIRRGIFRLN